MIQIQELRERFGTEAALIVVLLRCYFKKATGDEIEYYLQTQAIDWSHFQHLVYAYEIRPLIYEVVSRKRLPVNGDVLVELKEETLSVAAHNLEKLKESLRLLALLKEKNFLVVPFKGVFLSQFLFGDFSKRETVDIDFLVQQKDAWGITQLLLADGYQPTFDLDEKEINAIQKSFGELALKKDAWGPKMSVEIHGMVVQPSLFIPLSNKEVFQNLENVRLVGSEMQQMSAEYTLLTMICHHGVADFWRTLKHVVDLAAFVNEKRDTLNWQQFKEKTTDLKMKRTTEVGFFLMHAIFGIDLPKPFYIKKSKRAERVLQNLLTYPMLDRFNFSPEAFKQKLYLKDSFYLQLKTIFSRVKTKID